MIERLAGSRFVLSVLAAISTAVIATVAPTGLISGAAQAETTLNITEFPLPSPADTPDGGITVGPDGNLWFPSGTSEIGRITPSGVVTEFDIPTAVAAPYAITAGPDGNVWFTESNPNHDPSNIGRITPSGQITEFPVDTTSYAAGSNIPGIVAGPDGNLWFTISEADKIGRITPSGVVTEFPLPANTYGPESIVAGPDGDLWFIASLSGPPIIGRITTSGVITEFPVPGWGILSITAGPDGNIWFPDSGTNSIDRITPSGEITAFAVPTANAQPRAITTGSDGNLWFTEFNPSLTAESRIGRVTPSGDITDFPLPAGTNADGGITTGPDGNLWFTQSYDNGIGNEIGRVNLSNLDPTDASLNCSANPMAVGTVSTCTATVTDTGFSPVTPTGTVSLSSTGPGSFSGGGSCTLSGSGPSASCQLTYTQATTGEPTISIGYGGDGQHLPITRTATMTVYQPLNGNGTCTGLDGGTGQDVTVPAGATCTLVAGTVITGHVTDNGTLSVSDGTRIDGNLQAYDAGPLTVTGPSTTIGGNLQVQGGGPVTINGITIDGTLQVQQLAPGLGLNRICGAQVSGNLQWQDNASLVFIGGPGCAGNSVGGNLQVQDNTLLSGNPFHSAIVESNTVQKNLLIQNNTPPALVSGNTVGGNTQTS